MRRTVFFLRFFFLFFHWKVRYAEMRRDREEDLSSNDSLPKWPQRLELNQSEARSPEPLQDLPHRCRVPKLWAVLNCFPRPQAGSWMEVGRLGHKLVPIWDPGACKARTLAPKLWAPLNNFFKKRFIYFYWKGRYTERRRDREEDLPPDDSLP